MFRRIRWLPLYINAQCVYLLLTLQNGHRAGVIHWELRYNFVGYSFFFPGGSRKKKRTLDDSHHTGTSEIVQQLKVFTHHSEAYLLTVFFINCLVSYFHLFAVFNVLFNTFNCLYNFSCPCTMTAVEWTPLYIVVSPPSGGGGYFIKFSVPG